MARATVGRQPKARAPSRLPSVPRAREGPSLCPPHTAWAKKNRLHTSTHRAEEMAVQYWAGAAEQYHTLIRLNAPHREKNTDRGMSLKNLFAKNHNKASIPPINSAVNTWVPW